MSMLAEPKRKVKWTLNPRGNDWAKDESNYGQKMLKKMGWEKGKGLGKNEDGITDHIKVTYKNDKKGIGSKGYDDEWITHQDDFNAVLSSLNEQFQSASPSNEHNEPKLESLEKKSKSSRSRVHYHKFIRGKDISRYSNEDMAAIFGNKKKNEESDLKDESSQEDCKETSTSSMVTTYSSGQSMKEYFNQKMAALRNKNKKIADCQSDDFSTPSGEDDNNASGSHFILLEPEPTVNLEVVKEDPNNIVTKRKKHKKEKKRKSILDLPFDCENDPNEDDVSLTESNEKLYTNRHIFENHSHSQPLKLESHTKYQTNTAPAKTENSDATNENYIEATNNQITDYDKLLTKSSSEKKKRKRKLDENLELLEPKVYKGSNLHDNVSEDISGTNNLINCSKRDDAVKNNIAPNEINKSSSLSKIKKLKKDKRKKNTNGEIYYPNSSVCNTKESIRCNALQQMKLYFDIFPNRQILPVLKKYEKFCENFNNSGLATSNLLSVPGYGNELLFKD